MLQVRGGQRRQVPFTSYGISSTVIGLFIFSISFGVVLVICVTQEYYQFYPCFQAYLYGTLIFKISPLSVIIFPFYFSFYALVFCFLINYV